MATVRIYKVAELLGIPSQRVVELLRRDHGIEVQDSAQLFGGRIRDALGRVEPSVSQLLEHLLAESGPRRGRGRVETFGSRFEALELGLHFAPLFLFALDVDPPPRELRCQPDILALLPDGE